MSVPPEDQKHLDWAHAHTTPVITYSVSNAGRGVPIARGTGVLVCWHNRHFALTNTHVLERFWCCRGCGHEAFVELKGKEGERGIEEHGGYLLMPHKMSSIQGVVSAYDHKDVGIIEIKPQFVGEMEKRFLDESRLRTMPTSVSDEVFFKGFPAKSAEFHGAVDKAMFGWWADFRRIESVYDRLIITAPKPLRTYTDSAFDEDGAELKGISGSGVFSMDHDLVGLVWGGAGATVNSEIHIVPCSVIVDLLDEYEKRQPAQVPPAA